MECPKCGRENSESTPFCVRCHATLAYTCPACRHVQREGGKCVQCGVDFAKYAALLAFRMSSEAAQDRERSKSRAAILKQIVLLPITGGLSLVGYLRARIRGG